jgi:peptide/nickel transport system ATP-binding protein
VQAQIINLLQDLRARFGLALLFISHDLDIVELLCERVAVLYLGRVMEMGPTERVMRHPRHPYTRALLAASPKADPDGPKARRLIMGNIPSPLDPPSGCVFRTRCPQAQSLCAQERPVLRQEQDGHQFACHFDLAAGEAI